jgi:hypothetical protein
MNIVACRQCRTLTRAAQNLETLLASTHLPDHEEARLVLALHRVGQELLFLQAEVLASSLKPAGSTACNGES